MSDIMRFFDNVILDGPEQAEFEKKLFEEERSMPWPRVAVGTGKLEGKVAIVTGAAGGQGEMEAKAIAQQGAKVVCVTNKNHADLERVVAHIIRDGGEAIAVMADVSVEEDWPRIVKAAIDKWGRIDYLVNNAGVMSNGGVMNVTREAFQACLDVDVYGVLFGMKYCAPEMVKVGGGAIVNTASIYGAHFGTPNCIPYAASKAAVAGMTKAAAADLAPHNIRVNAVHPGYILTPMTYVRPANRVPLSNANLMKRYGLGSELAKPVVNLLSDDSSYITGQSLYVDGGCNIFLGTNNNKMR